jgi:ribosomal protein S18 acetylase RimI-like enzyme
MEDVGLVLPPQMLLRPFCKADLRSLREIRGDYLSDRCARVSRRGESPEVNFALRVEHLPTPFRSQGLSIVRRRDQEEVRGRMGEGSLQLVVEEDGRLIALLDSETESWRRVLRVWNLLVDQEYRRQGIGTELIQRAEQFGIDRRCRAISVETQATNWPALAFYVKMGFEICGVDDHYYTNRDLERKEVALFLYRELP